MNTGQTASWLISGFVGLETTTNPDSAARHSCIHLARRDTFHSGAEYTTEIAGNLPDSEVFSRSEFESAGFTRLEDLGRDGVNRKAARMAISMYSTSRHPFRRLNNGVSGLQSQIGARTMTKVNTPTKPATGSPSPLARQQAIENALSMALFHIRHGDARHGLYAATAKATRAVSMLKHACLDASTREI